MNLNEIKAKVILQGITMTKLSEKIKVERRTMYLKIKKQDEETIKKIDSFLKDNLICK